ncbi:MAG: LuxR C-terminal-related transcriptional regulator [Actinomycetota bacterium]|nr:LuxR C-terminal-related transcriptional regulator [Actinomycetota bacterium]
MAGSALRGSAGNLPAELTSFVGRRRELTEARALMATTRLMTLTGMGGVGKTRLARRLAADVHRAFPDGVWQVELAELHEPALVAVSVAQAVGLRDSQGQWTIGSLQERLADKHLLLVLDNCEHLLDACAVTADALLRGCPSVHVVATSRQPLGIDGEQVLALGPLAAPDPEQPGDLNRLAEFDAARLFADRAAAALPGFVLDAGNRRAVAELCRRLDGLPLALEFAATRVRALSPVEIVARLDRDARLSSHGSRLAPPRQQSLRALVDWSFQLCSEDERLLWRSLSVFAGSIDLETVEWVCRGTPLELAVVDLVVGLVDKSVLTREAREGRVCYRMPEALRDYGREKLAEAGEEVMARTRHRDWYVELVARAFLGFAGAEQLSWCHRLREEQADIRLALELCLDEPDPPGPAVGMVLGLLDYWLAFALISEGRHWLDRLLRADGAIGLPRARLLRATAYLASFQGEQPQLLTEAEGLARQAGDERELAWIAHAGSLGATVSGDYATATRLVAEAVSGMREAGDAHGTLLALAAQALLACAAEDFPTAQERADEFLAVARPLRESWVRSYVLWALGIAAFHAGDLSRAKALELESLELRVPFQDTMGLALCTEVLAWVAAAEGRLPEAALLHGAALHAAQAVGIDVGTYAYMSEDQDRLEALLRAELGPELEAARRRGADLDPAQVLELGSGTARPDRTGPTPADGDGSPLTPREQQIAELVAEGLSNKEIAARLVIATRTAEGHVERVLVKLGFTSRTQIAAWVAERQRA